MSSHQLSPSDFVALVNQTLEFAYPNVVIEGELSNFRVSKNRWVYFDLKDESASVKFFGTVYNLPGPLEEGMTVRVTGSPRLHALYGFSVTVQNIALSGEGTIKKAFELLLQKLTLEGLFAEERKRLLPYPPERIGLITSSESAAYADFVKILSVRWGGLRIELADVQVQGEPAAGQICRAIEYFNTHGDPPSVLVLIRGGGSADDLQTFNTEAVTRAVASSRIPIVVAIGHEIDTSLAELAADLRASTPSNAAELLVPDRGQILSGLETLKSDFGWLLNNTVNKARKMIEEIGSSLGETIERQLISNHINLEHSMHLLELLNPQSILKRGYAVIRSGTRIIRSPNELESKQEINITLAGGSIKAEVQ
jgi:exodeoxyribonuclease VII large subunit